MSVKSNARKLRKQNYTAKVAAWVKQGFVGKITIMPNA